MTKKISFHPAEILLQLVLWWTPNWRIDSPKGFHRVQIFVITCLMAGIFSPLNGFFYQDIQFEEAAIISMILPFGCCLFFLLLRTSLPTLLLEYGIATYLLCMILPVVYKTGGIESPLLTHLLFPIGLLLLVSTLQHSFYFLITTVVFYLIGAEIFSAQNGQLANLSAANWESLERKALFDQIFFTLVLFFEQNFQIKDSMDKLEEVDGRHKESQQTLSQNKKRLRLTERNLARSNKELEGIKKNQTLLLHETTQNLRETLTESQVRIENQKQFSHHLYKQILEHTSDLVNASEIVTQNGILNNENYLEKLQIRSEALSSLVMQASELSNPKVEYSSNSDFDLRQLILNSVDSHLPLGQNMFVQQETKLDYRIPRYLMGHPERIANILANLLHHAFCVTPKGQVHLQVRMLDQIADKIRLTFLVRDMGLVINPESLKNIFSPFATMDIYPAQVKNLNGLELSLAYKWVEDLGGKLRHEHSPGNGNVFSFVLDFSVSVLNEQFQERIPFQAENTLFTGMQILVIDENRVSQSLFEKFFRKWEINSQHVTTAAQAWKRLESQNNSFDLIFIEAQLPDSGGYELMKRIQETSQDCPIFLLQDNSQELPPEAQAFQGILHRPIEEKALFQILSQHAQNRNLSLS